MVWIIASNQLSAHSLRLAEKKIGCSAKVLSLQELRSHPPLQLIKNLRERKITSLFLWNEGDSLGSFLPLLKLIAFFSGAKSIHSLKAGVDDEPDPVTRLSILLSLIHLFLINVKARILVWRFGLQLKLLKKQNRLEPAWTLGEGDVAYIRSNLWLGLKAGGSVGHTAGVVNGFLNLGHRLKLFSPDRPVMVSEKADYREVNAPALLAYPPDLNNILYHETCVRHSVFFLEERPQFIYQRMSLNNFTGVQVSRKLGVPLVLEYNGSEVWVSKNWGRELANESFAIDCEEVCLKHAHVVVTVSQALGDELVERGVPPERVVVYPNCVDPESFRPGIANSETRQKLLDDLKLSPDDKIGTFVGTFGAWHGVDVLAKAIKHLVDHHKDWLDQSQLKFVLVGDGIQMPLVRETLRAAKYKPYFRLPGLVPQAEAPLYLDISHVLLSPHVPNEDGSRFFGSPTKLFEYMAMGKPIVASDLEQIGEVLYPGIRRSKDGSDWSADSENPLSILVTPGSVEELAQGIMHSLSGAPLLEHLGERARQRALGEYTWDIHVEKIIKGLVSSTPQHQLPEPKEKAEKKVAPFFLDWYRLPLLRTIEPGFARNVLNLFSVRIISVLFTFAVGVLVARSLGPEGQGQYAVAISLGLLAVQFGNLGLHAANTYFVGQDKKTLPALYANSNVLSIFAGTVLALISYGVYHFAPQLIPLGVTEFWVTVLWVPLGLATVFYQSLLLGLEENFTYNLGELMRRMITFIGVIALFFLGTMSVSLALMAVFTGTAAQLWITRRTIQKNLQSPPQASKELARRTASYGFNAFIAALFSYLALKIDIVIVQSLLGDRDSGLYSIAVNLSDALYMLPVTIGTLLFSRLSQENNSKNNWRFTQKTMLYSAGIMAPLLLFTGAFPDLLIRPFFGEDYLGSTQSLKYLMPGVFALSLTSICQNFLATVQNARLMTIGPLIASGVNIMLNFVLVPEYGIEGAAVSSTICYSIWLIVAYVLGSRSQRNV